VRIVHVLTMKGDPTEVLDEAVTMAQSLAVSFTNAANGHEVAEPPFDALTRAALPKATSPKGVKAASSAPKMPARRPGPKKP
jgi:hypothetical protein